MIPEHHDLRAPGAVHHVQTHLSIDRHEVLKSKGSSRVIVVQVLVAERNAMNALGYERFQGVLDLLLVAPVRETGRDRSAATTARPHSR